MNLTTAAVLPASFYNRDPVTVAKDLLGKLLIGGQAESAVAGLIVETEAYLAAHDPASHASRGKNNRNSAMFGPPGRAYVYAIHTHSCLNLVTEPEGVASAVLVRALQPVSGIELMRARRGVERLVDLTSGPGKLCQALGITVPAWNHWDLTQGRGLWLASPPAAPSSPIVATARVGVTAAQDLPLRFLLANNAFVSRGGPRFAERTPLRNSTPGAPPLKAG